MVKREIIKGDFSRKTILLTGPSGTIGTAVRDYFKKFYPEIRIIPYVFSPFHLEDLHEHLKDGMTDYFINTAALSHNEDSKLEPYQTFEINSTGVLKQLEMIRKYSPKTKYINFGSIYENNYLTPYAQSKKIARELICAYRYQYDLFCCQATLGYTEYFNRSDKFITRKITKKLAEIYYKRQNGESYTKLELDNVQDRFNFTWGEDCADGIWRILNTARPYDHTIINNNTCSLYEFVTEACIAADINFPEVVSFKENANRDSQISFKIDNLFTWQPYYQGRHIAAEMIKYDIEHYNDKAKVYAKTK